MTTAIPALPLVGEAPAGFMAVNRNKRSMVLDLRQDTGRAVFERMLQRADVVVENFRPGVMDRLGLGYSRLSELKPSIVYCTISGFGGSGPYRNRGGFDLVAQGMSGLMSITGHPDSPPAKVGVPITDISAGILAANGILCAYIYAKNTGQGQMVDTSLLEARNLLHRLGVVRVLRQRGNTWPAGLGPPGLRTLSSPADQRRVHQHRRRHAAHLGAVLPRTWIGRTHRGSEVQDARRS